MKKKVNCSVERCMKFCIAFVVFLGLFGIAKISKADSEVFRLYKPSSGEHLYTKNVSEANSLQNSGWNYEGVGWVAPDSGTQVFRLYNPNSSLHHYTSDTNERDSLIKAGWKYEQVAFHSGGNLPVYRAYNPNSGLHNFTSALGEQNSLVSVGWKNEGTAFYCKATAPNGTVNAANYILPWNLVKSGKSIINATNSKYSSLVQNAIPKWNALRSGTLVYSSTATSANVVCYDANEVNTALAVTGTDGKIIFYVKTMDAYSANVRTQTAIHELGHVLGIAHLPVYDDLMYDIASGKTTLSTQNATQFTAAAKKY